MTKIGRIDIIAQNGNDGLHYNEKDRPTCYGEYTKYGDCLCKNCRWLKECCSTTAFLDVVEKVANKEDNG